MPSDSLAARLARNASERGTKVAFRFVDYAGTAGGDLTWEALWRLGERRAGELRRQALSGRRIGIFCPEPRDFIVALVATFLADAVAVPMPAVLSRRGLPRIGAIIQAADLAAVIAPQAMLDAGAFGPTVRGISLEHLENAPDARAGSEHGDTGLPALLQFTSGSTGNPKGVLLSHANVAAGCEAISRAYGLGAESVGLSWLPLHHDMGLIGHVLTPIWVGGRSVILNPLRFLQKPLRWLQAVGDERAVITSAPNFAYELCNRAAANAPDLHLDLSSLATAVCGGEPVLPATMEAFAERFAPHGFRREAFAPSYGLAEATLLVASGRRAGGPRVLSGAAGTGGLLTSVGPPVEGSRVRIVDAASGRFLPEGEIGEIEVAGPSVGRFLDGPFQDWVKTGDLGFLSEGELCIAGRSKELLIVRGQNVFPADIEAAALSASSRIVPGGVAAVGVEREGTQHIAVVLEVRAPAADIRGLRLAVGEAITAATGHVASHVVPVAPGSMPRTTSGKLRRQEVARLYRNGELVHIAPHKEEVPL